MGKDTELPDKLNYRIGEVSEYFSIKPSVLRYWETEFPQLSPKKSSTGQRLYSKRDVDLIRNIRKLLYSDRLTISGAKKIINRNLSKEIEPQVVKEEGKHLQEVLNIVREELQRIRQSLD